MKRILIFVAAVFLTGCITSAPARAPEQKDVRVHGDTAIDVSGIRMVVIQFLQSDTATMKIQGGADLQELWIHNNSTWEIRIDDTDGGMRMYPFQTAHMIYSAAASTWFWTLEGK